MHSWNDIMNNKLIDSIEDPVLSFEIGKEEFEEQYEEIVNKINCVKDAAGKFVPTTTMDYFFEIHPLRKNVLIFKNEDKKWEFYEIGIKLNSVVDLSKIYDGTQNEDENKEINNYCKKITFAE